MTCRRDSSGFASAWFQVRALGEAWVAERLGVDPSRLRQLANPNRADCAVLDLAVAADALAAAEGRGTPILDCYRRRLQATLDAPMLSSRGSRRGTGALAALRAAAASLSEAIDSLSAAAPAPEGAR